MEVRFVPLTNDTPKNRLAKLVTRGRNIEIQRQALKAEYEMHLAKLNEAYETRVKSLVDETNEVMDDAALLVSDFRDELFTDGKTLKFADGEVSIRLGQNAVVMPDGVTEADVIDELRKKGLLNKTTIRPPRKLSKSMILKKPLVVAACKTLRIEQRERVSIKLPDNAGKLEHDLPSPPLRRDLT